MSNSAKGIPSSIDLGLDPTSFHINRYHAKNETVDYFRANPRLMKTLFYFLFTVSLMGISYTPGVAQSNEQIDALLDSVKAIRGTEFDRAEALAKQALEQAQRTNYTLGEMSAFSNLGTIYRNRGQQQEAIRWYEKGFLVGDSADYVRGWASLHNNIGVCYDYLGEFKVAIRHYMAAVKAWESMEDWYYVAGVSNNIGNIYESLKDYDEAIAIYQRALSSSEAQEDPVSYTHLTLPTIA